MLVADLVVNAINTPLLLQKIKTNSNRWEYNLIVSYRVFQAFPGCLKSKNEETSKPTATSPIILEPSKSAQKYVVDSTYLGTK